MFHVILNKANLVTVAAFVNRMNSQVLAAKRCSEFEESPRVVLDHISIAVSDFQRSAEFYEAAMTALGYVRVFESDNAIGYAQSGQCDDAFAIRRATAWFVPAPQMHIAFAASSRDAAVRRFHDAALRVGAASDGEPGLHAEYGAGYFAAFVIDPDGYRLEAVWHEPVVPDRMDARP